jgi:hypothetical protein
VAVAWAKIQAAQPPRDSLGVPEAVRDNSDKLIVPIPVDPENDQFPRSPNDTFPIISSTGIGGEGCRVVGDNRDGGGKKSAHADRAVRGLEPALDHVIDPWLPPTASGFDGATGAVGGSEHKDFFWPPILKTFLILRGSLWLGVPQDEDPDNAFKIQ